MQSDEEVGKVAAPVPVIISRALELFAEALLKKANSVTAGRGARTLTPSHLKSCIHSEARFDFLRDMVASVPELQGDVDCEPSPIHSGVPGEQVGTLPGNAGMPPNTHPPIPQFIPKPKSRGVSQPRGRGSGPRGRGRGSPRGTGRPRGRPRKLPEGSIPNMPPLEPLEPLEHNNTKPSKRDRDTQETRYVEDPGTESDSDSDSVVEEVFPVSPPMSPSEHSYHQVNLTSPTKSFQDYYHSPQTQNNGVQGRLSDAHPEPTIKYNVSMDSHFNPGPHQSVSFNRSHSVPVSDSLSHPNPNLPRTNSISVSEDQVLPRSPTYHHAQPRRPSYQETSSYPPRSPYADHSGAPLPGHHAMPGAPPSGPPYRPYTSPYDHYRGPYGQPDSGAHHKSAAPQFGSYKTGINGMFSVDKLNEPVQRNVEQSQKVMQSPQNTLPQQGVQGGLNQQEMDEDYDCY